MTYAMFTDTTNFAEIQKLYLADLEYRGGMTRLYTVSLGILVPDRFAFVDELNVKIGKFAFIDFNFAPNRKVVSSCKSKKPIITDLGADFLYLTDKREQFMYVHEIWLSQRKSRQKIMAELTKQQNKSDATVLQTVKGA